ncbi:hypothetical protein WG66_010455 [Moniliophthora roreri]|nr:hypothetical protein WG66_010455 [Moniliophthora roreri]
MNSIWSLFESGWKAKGYAERNGKYRDSEERKKWMPPHPSFFSITTIGPPTLCPMPYALPDNIQMSQLRVALERQASWKNAK